MLSQGFSFSVSSFFVFIYLIFFMEEDGISLIFLISFKSKQTKAEAGD